MQGDLSKRLPNEGPVSRHRLCFSSTVTCVSVGGVPGETPGLGRVRFLPVTDRIDRFFSG